MRETLPIALRLCFGHEGGYSNRPTDKGGPTKFGITAKTLAAHLGKPSVTAERVQALTIAEAETIYRKSYWSQSGGDVLPKGLDYAAFDFGVNSGPNRAVKTLQKVLGVKQDGWIGEATLAAVKEYEGGTAQLIRDYCKARMAFLMNIKGSQGWSANGRGWTIRVTGKDPKGQWKDQPGVLGNALKMAADDFEPVRDAPNDYDGAPEGGDAKAEPKPDNPWFEPGSILSYGGGLIGSIGMLFEGSGPVQWALAGAILIAVGAGAYLLIRKLGKAQA
jgi:lysozyme family protein